MPLDFTKPVTSDNHATQLLPNLVNAHVALAQGLDPAVVGTLISTPTGAKRFNAGLIEQFNGTSWAPYTMGFPTFGGVGAGGTWSINITGLSGGSPTVGGFTPSAAAGVANRVVVADASGYIINTYYNGSDEGTAGTAGTVTGVLAKRGDNYYRTTNAASVAAYLSGQAMNIAGSSSSCTGNAASATTAGACSGNAASATNATNATTATNLAGGSVSATTLTATGPLRGNSGAKGWGAITTTTSTATPTGGAAGDFVLIY